MLLATACGQANPQLVVSGPTMGTTYTVKIAAPPADVDAARVRATTEDVLARIDRSMSGYRPDSEVARFNASASTAWHAVSTELAAVVKMALQVSESTGGAFDITVAPLVAAWGFGPTGEPGQLPSADQLSRISTDVGFRKLSVRTQPAALRKAAAGLTVDLNGIAPGFAVDRLAERLLAMGIRNFMIDIGGEIRAHGRNSRGEAWHVGIEHPVETARVPYASVRLEDAAVATSGEYRRYYMRNGRRYSHTIDPRTARPVEHQPGSVVVIAGEAALSDAWATALNVLGPTAGYEVALERGIPALFIERHAGQWCSRATPPFERSLAKARP